MKVIIRKRIQTDISNYCTTYSYMFKQKHCDDGYNYITVARVIYKIITDIEAYNSMLQFDKLDDDFCLPNMISRCWAAFSFTKNFRIPTDVGISSLDLPKDFGL